MLNPDIKVMMVGSAEQSKGGIASVIRIMKKMPIWQEYSCYWLGTQIQSKKITKLYYALKAYCIALFKIWEYDIIHFHTSTDMLIQLPVFLLAKLGRKKIIIQLHVGNQIENTKFNQKKIFRYCIRHSDLVLLLSPTWKNKFDTIFAVYNRKSDYLYNACLPVNAIDYHKRTKTIIYAANMKKNKAYDILLNAFAMIKNTHSDWKLIMMGDGETEKAKLLAQELGIEHQTIFTGYVTGKEKEKYFQEASIFCLCSYLEGFPMVVLEAWGYGVPVITTPVGGLPDVIEDGKNALTFNYGDYKELANKLNYLITNPEKREFISYYSKEFVYQHFSIEIISNKLNDIYQTI